MRRIRSKVISTHPSRWMDSLSNTAVAKLPSIWRHKTCLTRHSRRILRRCKDRLDSIVRRFATAHRRVAPPGGRRRKASPQSGSSVMVAAGRPHSRRHGSCPQLCATETDLSVCAPRRQTKATQSIPTVAGRRCVSTNIFTPLRSAPPPSHRRHRLHSPPQGQGFQ